jgi:large conductance mechanosensitive channel
MWKEFRHFIARGNVVDLAVGVIIGAAFGKIVTDLVDGIIMPPIGLVLKRVDFQSLFVVLDYSKGVPASLADAKTKGIPVIAYGQLFNDVLSFLIIGVVVFLMVREVNKIKNSVSIWRRGPTTKVRSARRRSRSKPSVARSVRRKFLNRGALAALVR